MKKLSLLIFIFLIALGCNKNEWGEHPQSIIDTVKKEFPNDFGFLNGRDPFILADPVNKLYYLPFNNLPNFRMYSSPDLKNWKDEGYVFTLKNDFWGTKDFWAPDLYFYNNKYYIFATFSGATSKRGTSILVSDKPTGPFEPLINRAITPNEWTCIDASLYVDDAGTPWMLYCREWIEVVDGQVIAQQLSDDLKSTVGQPKILFRASQAPWVGSISANINGTVVRGYVTDAPFLYKSQSGKLLMLWSSFDKAGKYAIGIATSQNGSIEGPWIHENSALNTDDGGHAMVFKDFSGQLWISYHAPNSGNSKPKLYKVTESQDKLIINY